MSLIPVLTNCTCECRVCGEIGDAASFWYDDGDDDPDGSDTLCEDCADCAR